jgi:magnesium-transporting ATPase (P-type)
VPTIPGFTFYIVFIFYYIVSIVIGYLYNPPPRGSRKDKIKDWWTFMGNETIYRMFIIFVGPLAIFVSLGILYMLTIVGQPKLLESISNFTTLKKIMAAIVCVLFIYFLIEIIVNVTSKRPIFKRGSLETNILRGATLYTTIGIMAGLTFLLLFFTPFSKVNINYLNEQWKEIKPNIFFLWFLCLCVALIVHISFLFDISYVIAAIVFMLFFSYLSK